METNLTALFPLFVAQAGNPETEMAATYLLRGLDSMERFFLSMIIFNQTHESDCPHAHEGKPTVTPEATAQYFNARLRLDPEAFMDELKALPDDGEKAMAYYKMVGTLLSDEKAIENYKRIEPIRVDVFIIPMPEEEEPAPIPMPRAPKVQQL